MAIDGIHFQKGLSQAAFLKDYGTEEQCEAAFIKARWPNEFVGTVNLAEAITPLQKTEMPNTQHYRGFRYPARSSAMRSGSISAFLSAC